MKPWIGAVAVLAACGALGFAYWKLAIPVNRVESGSELIMLGDLNGDHRWTAADLAAVDAFLEGETQLPFPVRPTDRAISL